MKTTTQGLLAFLMMLIVQFSFAQQKSVTGTVVDEDGIPIPSVNVFIKGTSDGTQTDFDGNYALEVGSDQTIVFSYVGFLTQEILVGDQSTINVTLASDVEQLNEVLVTAQGIKREKKALGYAVSSIKSKDIEQRTEGDLGRVLRGKASGVNITQQSGLSGTATNITIRGNLSFSQNNQPLFIVDGVPFSSDTNASGDFVDGNSGSSRFLDLDPNTVESVNVLKGLSAATLYGEAGKNGVILITTKAGSIGGAAKKSEVTVSTSVFFNEIASMPDYQYQYGNGFDQAFGWFFSNWGPSFDRGGPAGWGNQAAIDDNGTLEHPYSTASSATGIPQAFPEFAGARYDWRPYRSVENFFRTGTVLSTSVSANGTSSDGKVGYNFTYGNLVDEGFTPGNKVARNNFSMGGRAELSNKFTISGTVNYSRTNFKTPPFAASQGNGSFGDGSSIFGNLFFTPISVDLLGLPYQNPITGASVYYRQNNSIQHPLWTVNNAQNRQLTNRFFGNFTAQFDFNDNLNLVYRLGYDFYNERNRNYQNKGGVDLPARTISGTLDTFDNNNMIWDHNFILTGNYDLDDDFDVTFNLGATSRYRHYDRQGVSSSGQNVFGVLRHFNYDLQDEIQFTTYQNIVGLYGQAEFSYKDYLFLTVNGRNDWASNQPEDGNSLFYKGGSLAYIATSSIDGLRSKNLNFLKFRAGYGESAGFATGFPTSTNLSIDTQRFLDGANTVVTNTSANVLANPNIKPERYTEVEFGVESRLFNNRVTFDASYFNRITEDLIIDRPLDPSTGGTFIQTNLGEVEGWGIEADLGIDILRKQDTNGFGWNVNSNFTLIRNEVTDLGADTDIIIYEGFTDLGNAAIKGFPLGTMVGSRIGRDENGNFLVDGNGDYVIENQDENGRIPVIGDPNPDFVLNVGNTFSYKNLSLNVLINYVQGGDIYSSTVATLLGRGLIEETVNRESTYILPGISQATGQPNTTQINNSTYYFNNVLFGPSELQVYDATAIRLQEVSLSYSLPKKLLEKTPFGSVSLSAQGFNLWFKAVNIPESANFDPNVAGLGVGNGQGFEFLNGPSGRRYGFSVKATF